MNSFRGGRGHGRKKSQNVCKSEGDGLFNDPKGRHGEQSPVGPSVEEAQEWVYIQDCHFFFLFAFSRAAPAAYGGSQVRGLIGAVAVGLTPEPQQHGI